ncbi:MAG: Sua5/YciO/YrdC/YwlC family protein [Moraxella sp.]|nr:Sua5/YciO/YrdC/YwlC family protein [Moraxella sp.]
MKTHYIHPDNPQARLLKDATDALKQGQLIVFCDETGYQLGFSPSNKSALDALKRLGLADKLDDITLLCADLSQASHYTTLDNAQFRLLKAHGEQARFLLTAEKSTPKALHQKDKAVALRLTTPPLTQALIESMGEPLGALPLVASGLLDETQAGFAYAIEDTLDGRIEVFLNTGDTHPKQLPLINAIDTPATLAKAGDTPLDWIE